jgi:hypothetical protein
MSAVKEWRAATMLGRLSNGNESDHGQLVHAVIWVSVPSPKMPINIEVEKSLCYKRPGRKSVGWSSEKNLKVNCDKCLKRLRKL